MSAIGGQASVSGDDLFSVVKFFEKIFNIKRIIAKLK